MQRESPDAPADTPAQPTRPVLIAGPTASGKSALALALARQLDGVVINADSQQVYREWRILTARPSPAEEAAAPHRLYGHVGLREAYSVGRWLAEVRDVLAEAASTPPRPLPFQGRATPGDEAPAVALASAPPARGRVAVGVRAGRVPPVIVGGTGLYFKALTEGLAPIPEIPAGIRTAGEAALERLGLAAFAGRLAARDPQTAAALDLANPRRVLRAWEVLEATGTGLAEWKARTPPPLLPLAACTAVALHPPRDWLRRRCDARLDRMLRAGALDEVRHVLSLGLKGMPGLRAVGAADLARHIEGELTLAEAAARAKAETGRYAKRQLTWMRNQMPTWTALDPSRPDLVVRALALVVEGAG